MLLSLPSITRKCASLHSGHVDTLIFLHENIERKVVMWGSADLGQVGVGPKNVTLFARRVKLFYKDGLEKKKTTHASLAQGL